MGNLAALALGYVQSDEIPADLPVKTTDDVDQGGGDGGGRERVSNSRRPSPFVPSSRLGFGRLALSVLSLFSFFSYFFSCEVPHLSSLANERRENISK